MAALTRCTSCNNAYSCSHRAALKDLPRMGETIVPFSTVRLLTLSFSLCVFFLPLPAPNGKETKRGWKAVFLWSLLGWRSETRPGAAPYSPYQPSCSCLFSASYNLSTTRTSVLIPCSVSLLRMLFETVLRNGTGRRDSKYFMFKARNTPASKPGSRTPSLLQQSTHPVAMVTVCRTPTLHAANRFTFSCYVIFLCCTTLGPHATSPMFWLRNVSLKLSYRKKKIFISLNSFGQDKTRFV